MQRWWETNINTKLCYTLHYSFRSFSILFLLNVPIRCFYEPMVTVVYVFHLLVLNSLFECWHISMYFYLRVSTGQFCSFTSKAFETWTHVREQCAVHTNIKKMSNRRNSNWWHLLPYSRKIPKKKVANKREGRRNFEGVCTLYFYTFLIFFYIEGHLILLMSPCQP